MSNNTDASFKIPNPPRGRKAILWRLPIWIYRLRLGWIFGHRALLLNHRGRISGKPRQAVLEVIKYEKETNTHFVVSGFGEKSQWFQNILKTPDVTFQAGSRKFPALAEQLSPNEGERVFQDYQQRHPNAIKNLNKMIGYNLGESEEEIRAFMRKIPVVRLRPKS